jgi:hypothetical protein
MERWRKFTKIEGAAYHALADAMRRLEWDLHNLIWRGHGLPPEWAEIAEDAGPGPKTRVTLWVDARAVRFFRGTGKGWQTRMNDVLTAFVNARVAGVLRGPEHFDLKRSAEQGDVPLTRPGPGFSEREEAEGRALEDALLAEVDRIAREEG